MAMLPLAHAEIAAMQLQLSQYVQERSLAAVTASVLNHRLISAPALTDGQEVTAVNAHALQMYRGSQSLVQTTRHTSQRTWSALTWARVTVIQGCAHVTLALLGLHVRPSPALGKRIYATVMGSVSI